MSRSRNYVFTLNNYQPEDERILDSLPCKYLVYGRERGESGTPHLQGYVVFTSAKSFNATKVFLPAGCHIELAKGNHQQAANYCKKDGDFVERGSLPLDAKRKGQLEKDRWEEIWKLAKEGKIDDIDADVRLRLYGTLRRIARDYQSPLPLLDTPCGIWIWGESGCGKTGSVFATYPSLYSKGLNKWWCGYQGEEVVLLDDVDPTHATWLGGFLKRWVDKYPFIGESKGHSYSIRPKKFIVTSQYPIDIVFPDIETRDAITRRFTVINKIKDQNIII